MPTDLVLLVADKDIEHAVRGLLSRPQALGIRPISSTIHVHPQRDPACAQKSHEFLRQFAVDYDRALVVFDHQGCGREDRVPAQVEHDVRQLLSANGWNDRADAVVIAPELEVWIFSESPQVETGLAWRGPGSLRGWLEKKGLWSPQHPKPVDPRVALENALRKLHRARSAAIYEDLARIVGLGRCQDVAFNRFKSVLQRGFPPEGN
jgi:hypothetical protein